MSINAKQQSIDNLVMGTVNASWKNTLDADILARLISNSQTAGHLPHLATFFSEVRDTLILAFADAHQVSLAELQKTYTLVKEQTGETNIHLENDFDELGRAS